MWRESVISVVVVVVIYFEQIMHQELLQRPATKAGGSACTLYKCQQD